MYVHWGRLYRQYGHFFDWKIKSMRVVSSVLRNGLRINALMSCCKETWAGDGWRAWGGGVAGNPRPVLDLNEKFYVSERAWWAFLAVIAAWREGVNVCPPAPPPSRRIARRSPKTHVKERWLGPRTRPTRRARPRPPCAQSVEKDRNIVADL